MPTEKDTDIQGRVIEVAHRFRNVDQAALPRDGGGGNDGGVTDDWKESVNKQLVQLHGDFRMLLGALAIAFVFLVGSGAVMYDRINDRFDRLEQRTGDRFVKVDGGFTRLDASLADLRVEQANVNAKLDLLLERQTKPR